EAISFLNNKSMNSLVSYLQSTDLLSKDSDAEKDIVLTTVHKAKGKEFENVIYIPTKTNNRNNFQDSVVEGILKSKGVDVEEELEEETLRINFVAFTRAEKNLIILSDKIKDYLNDCAELKNIDVDETKCLDMNESKKRAFDLFVNKRFDEAKELLESRRNWIKKFVDDYFKSLEHISFSSLPEKAYGYFVDKILGIRRVSFATNLGSEVHEAAKQILLGEEYSVSEPAKPFVENVKKLIEGIDYDDVKPELRLEPQLTSLGFESPLKFKSFIDAVFRKGDEYLIVDWKTDKKNNYASKHRQQLEAYRRVFSAKENVPIDKIKVAIGYVGLRSTINMGKVECELDIRQPATSAFNTFSKRVDLLLSWIKRPEGFFEALLEEEVDDLLWKSVVEEYKKE
ncbi:MAG: 3'-5' exonuclease, partial [Thermotogota bacterium]|nr:3'-5' exonuclease [Thermotogota bacterium]